MLASALGDKPFVTHRPMGECNPDKMQFAYAIGKVHGSECPIIECWPDLRIRKHRDKYNKVGLKHYSFSNWEMYARKVVLLQVIKYLPQSVELSNALEAEYNADKPATLNGSVVSSLDNLTDRLIGAEDKADSKQAIDQTALVAELIKSLSECNSETDHDKLSEQVDANWSSFTVEQREKLQAALKEAAERLGLV